MQTKERQAIGSTTNHDAVLHCLLDNRRHLRHLWMKSVAVLSADQETGVSPPRQGKRDTPAAQICWRICTGCVPAEGAIRRSHLPSADLEIGVPFAAASSRRCDQAIAFAFSPARGACAAIVRRE
jgi:hypothetical protein